MSHDRRRRSPEDSASSAGAGSSRAGAGRALPPTTAQLARWVQRAVAPPAVGPEREPEAATAIAAEGVSGPRGTLPFIDEFLGSFGRHDVSDVGAHVGGEAARIGRARRPWLRDRQRGRLRRDARSAPGRA